MFIQTEETPNPQVLKFIPDGKEVLKTGGEEFKTQKQAAIKSPLATQLFEVKGVCSVFLGKDFISITKDSNTQWEALKADIQATIMDFFVSGKEVMFEKNDSDEDGEDDEITKQIKELIEIKVRPAVAMDGGDIVFHEFKDGIVRLELKGACSGCPSSTITLKNGIENMLKHYVPEVESVEQIEDY